MKPKIRTTDVQIAGKAILPKQEIHLQEQFVRQIKDDFLPANQVLAQQKDERTPDDPAPLFVP